MTKEKRYILNKSAVGRKLNRLALEIIENNIDEKELLFAGIGTSGMILAAQLRQIVIDASELKVALLQMTMDKKKPQNTRLEADMNYNDKVIIIIDDVTNTGRTLMYALQPFLKYYPKKIQTLVLVERTYTQFPINANYKGFSLATTLQEHIVVEVSNSEITGAYLA